MRSIFLATLFGAGLAGGAPAEAATTFTWAFTALEEVNEAPVENVVINFDLEDGRSGAQSILTCTTNEHGKCLIEGTVSDGGFFTGSTANWKFGISKPEYAAEFKFRSRKLNSTAYAVTVLVKAIPKPLNFSFVDPSGKPLEGVEIVYDESGKTGATSACTTDSSGGCTFAPQKEIRGQFIARKDGYYKALASGQPGAKPLLLRPRYEQLELREAASNATLRCAVKDICDRVYSTAQIFMSRHVDMKIQFSNDTITETHNAVEPTQMAGRVTRTPLGKLGWEVALDVYCGKAKDAPATLWEQATADQRELACADKQMAAYKEYRSWVRPRAE